MDLPHFFFLLSLSLLLPFLASPPTILYASSVSFFSLLFLSLSYYPQLTLSLLLLLTYAPHPFSSVSSFILSPLFSSAFIFCHSSFWVTFICLLGLNQFPKIPFFEDSGVVFRLYVDFPMAETRRYLPNQSLDLEQILREAQHRWLRPAEICEILRNYKSFSLTQEPPLRPSAGSLYLFDRKVLRYFRKDGHRWRKKKDGKTVKEAHEKLKAGSVDVLHCYYAHGEGNENFQRRSYWMLEEKFEHIVLVHYREVKEGYKLGTSHLPNVDPETLLGRPQFSSAYLQQFPSLVPVVQASYKSIPEEVGRNKLIVPSEFEDRDSRENPTATPYVHLVHCSAHGNPFSYPDQTTGCPELSRSEDSFTTGSYSCTWTNIHGTIEKADLTDSQKLYFEQPGTADFLSNKVIGAELGADGGSSAELVPNVQKEYNFNLTRLESENCASPPEESSFPSKVVNSPHVCGVSGDESGELKKLDSFGRWMDKEIGKDCDDSLMASDSCNYWNALETENGDNEVVSSLSHHMQLDTDTLGPSLSQEQFYTINDFAPDWAYSGVETKVLITGSFLVDNYNSADYKWCCMFGENEVSAEVLSDDVIRCQVPFHAPGRVPFYITCGNRLACSEVREFDYRKNSLRAESHIGNNTIGDDIHLQIRLAKLLYSDIERMWLGCSIINCDKCKVKTSLCSLKSNRDWAKLEVAVPLVEQNHIHVTNALIQNFLKDKLYEWLVCKAHEGGKELHVLDSEGQGVIHLVASLGYYWAISPIAAVGINLNYRDARGRTALHWASYYGREETVTMLVQLGAVPGAVDDPTPTFPGGQTAADLASSRGHKGIAGYVAEADLVYHLSLLSMNGTIEESTAGSIAGENALETAPQDVVPLNMTIGKEISLQGSLAAVKKSAHAAGLIQAAFRINSFRQRELNKSKDDVSEASIDLVALGSLNKVQKMSHFDDYLHSAAIKIQQKYRGWKGRKEFLKIRDRIVRIQAHLRGHRVRKHYRKIVWSVSIVEKVILRWRRKKAGLRGFHIENPNEASVSDGEKNDEYAYLSIGRKQKFAGVEKALARVQSMARYPDARDQYMRMLLKSENSKLEQ